MRGPMKIGMIGSSFSQIFSSDVAMACCFFGSSVAFHWFSSFVAVGSYVCSQLPVLEASLPEAM